MDLRIGKHIGCDEPLTVAHILTRCWDLYDIRRKHYSVENFKGYVAMGSGLGWRGGEDDWTIRGLNSGTRMELPGTL